MIDAGILNHYVTRVQLATQEYRDAKKHVDLLALQLQTAHEHRQRCLEAENVAKHELTEYAATGVRKVYCVQCDEFYVYAPAKDQREPGCPKCNRASLGQEMSDLATGRKEEFSKGEPERSAQKWML